VGKKSFSSRIDEINGFTRKSDPERKTLNDLREFIPTVQKKEEALKDASIVYEYSSVEVENLSQEEDQAMEEVKEDPSDESFSLNSKNKKKKPKRRCIFSAKKKRLGLPRGKTLGFCNKSASSQSGSKRSDQF